MLFTTMLSKLALAFCVSLEIFAVTLVGALPLGLLVAFGRMSRFKPLSLIIQFYISIMRGTPLMLQLLVIYFGPYFLFGISIGYSYRMTATIIAFILNYAAYFAEIYRGGIESIPVGQYEAADVLGYSKSQTFFKIVLPQVVKRILPAMSNEVITLIKDTSLAFAIGVAEMFTTAQALGNANTSMVPFAIAAVFYYVFNLIIAWALGRWEKHLAYYHE